VLDSAALFGSVNDAGALAPDDSSSEELLIEGPERESRIGPLIVSLSIVMGVLLIVLIMVALRPKANERVQAQSKVDPIAKRDKPATVLTDLKRETEKESSTEDPRAAEVSDVSGEIRRLRDKLAKQSKKNEPGALPEEVWEEPPKEPESKEREPSLGGVTKGRSAKTTDQRQADLTSTGQAIVKRFNHFRRLAGLSPVIASATLTAGCQAHAKYLVLHEGEPVCRGLRAHTETPQLAGYTEEGCAAAKSSVITSSLGRPNTGWPAIAVDELMATLFHRIPMLEPDLKRIGIGHAATAQGTVWQVVIDVRSGVEHEFLAPLRAEPVIFPPDKQKDVPRTFGLGGMEEPNPIPFATGHCGYPVTVSFPKDDQIQEATAILEYVPTKKLPDYMVAQVPVWLSTPERPALPMQSQQNTICLIAKGKLPPLTAHKVTVRAKVNGEPWEKVWKFTTGAQ
jgi:uncharacterized protein YkwD